ncbi:NAD-dependent epimerase/dehydratase family protein [Pseudonocardia spinosispora]|uniref:NAD-dependent epimerase/dehydratase family protein n=1 Tax=Pseudonocardia spinosispora TaxID=103441 RepID=UPI0003FCE083|nr:epimerase [Pseudonocardia spinosispora]
MAAASECTATVADELTVTDELTVADELATLDRGLWWPSDAVVADLAAVTGDVLLLGAGGKLGLSLATMARLALDRAERAERADGIDRAVARRRVVAVSRFADPGATEPFHDAGVETIAADLSDPGALRGLPDAENVIYLVGRKFGTHGDPWATWAVNTYLAAQVAQRFVGSRIVAFSTGNVYPLTPVGSGGADENTAPSPVGEYAQSCLGRERLLQHVSISTGTPMSILRLNYAIDLRYGVLHDIARAVWASEPVDVTMGSVNVLWQGDVNAMTLRSLRHCTSPPDVLNLTGPETVSVRWLATEFAARLGREPIIAGQEASTALLSNASRAMARFGYPTVSVREMIEKTCRWIEAGGPSHGKPTKFEQRGGVF